MFDGVAISNWQSLAQLGVAVSLAFLVAGPSLRSALAMFFANAQAYKKMLNSFKEMNAKDPGWFGTPDPDGTFPKVVWVEQLLEVLETYLQSQTRRIAPQNPHTTTMYTVFATFFFVLLVIFSLFPTAEWPRALGVLLATTVGFVLLYDPLRVSFAAHPLQNFAHSILKLAFHVGPGPHDPGLVSDLISAHSVIFKLSSGSMNLTEAKQAVDRLLSKRNKKQQQR